MAPLPRRFLILDDGSGTQPPASNARGGQVRHGTQARREIQYLERQRLSRDLQDTENRLQQLAGTRSFAHFFREFLTFETGWRMAE